jgi:signal transduction histidine kinase
MELDWSATPLGPIDTWPQSLRTAAGMVIRQGIAQNLCWGPDLIQIYNDSYRLLMGRKHPAGLGRSVLWSWAEIRHEIEPLFERVWQGETVYFEDLLLRVERGGEPEDAYFTFSYSPVVIETGSVGGVLINSFETMQQVQARTLQRERDALLEELEVERARLEYVFKQAPAFLAVLRGPQHVFQLVNDAYYQLIGHREVVGKPVRLALPEVVDQGFITLLDSVLETGEPFLARELPVVLARRAGHAPEERFVDLTYITMLEADGTRSGVIAHGTDVTAQVLARREVERLLAESERQRGAAEAARAEAESARIDAEAARVEAETANRAKSDFLASMSHELRTPLNAIGGYVDLLDAGVYGQLAEPQRAALERVKISQRHLLRLINDVLSFARIEAGQITLDLRPHLADDLLHSVEPLVAPMAEAKGITLTVADCAGRRRVIADDERVLQILLNLVVNAVKFTPAGGRIDLRCTQGSDWVEIDVADDGPGIPPEKLASIFDPFIQIDRRLSNPRDGVGLGLAISRDLARTMKGDLTVVSEPGRGSTFTLRLPAEAPTEQA